MAAAQTESLGHAAQNVQALAEIHAKAEQEVPRHQRIIESLTTKLSRPHLLFGLAAAILLWILFNVLAPVLGLRQLDPPPFFWMQGCVGLAALFLTTTVLITQRRQGQMAARQELLDLHVNLLAEQKVAKVIALLEELRRDLPSVSKRPDAVAEAMSQPLDPQAAIDKLQEEIEHAIAEQHGGRFDERTEAESMAEDLAEVVREARKPGR